MGMAVREVRPPQPSIDVETASKNNRAARPFLLHRTLSSPVAGLANGDVSVGYPTDRDLRPGYVPCLMTEVPR